VRELSLKTPVYGTLVGLLNVKNADFGREITQRTGNELEAALRRGDGESVKLLVRFIGELANANVVPSSAVVAVFDQLLAPAAAFAGSGDEATATAQKRADLFIYIILSVLPYTANNLADRCPDDLERMLDTIKLYLAKRSTAVLSAVAVYEAEEVRLVLIFSFV
jgi:nuclear cap-binding protein subunit 1